MKEKLIFWTDKHWYHWAAWGLPLAGMLLLVLELAGVLPNPHEDGLHVVILIRIVRVIVSLTFIWLGLRLWKEHRITLDRRQPDPHCRAVLYNDRSYVQLESFNFTGYRSWDFSDAETAKKRAAEIAEFWKLPLESSPLPQVVLYRGWNPPDWNDIDTDSFFRNLSAFCEACKAAGYPAEADALLNRIRACSTFENLGKAVAEFPENVLPAERQKLAEGVEHTKLRMAAEDEFLKACDVGPGLTSGVLLSRDIRKLLPEGVTADMRLGDLVPDWFETTPVSTEVLLEWMDVLGDECAVCLAGLAPQPDWRVRELIRKYVDAFHRDLKKNVVARSKRL